MSNGGELVRKRDESGKKVGRALTRAMIGGKDRRSVREPMCESTAARSDGEKEGEKRGKGAAYGTY